MSNGLAGEDKAALRAEVEQATLEEVRRVGVEAFETITIAKIFKGRVSQATIYRWVEAALGRVMQAVAHDIKDAAQQRIEREDDPAESVVADVEAKLPAMVAVDDLVPSGGSIQLIDRLMRSLEAAEQVMSYARHQDGSVRSAKMLLLASEHNRRTLDTALRMQQAMREISDIDQFHRDILDMVRRVAKNHPAAAEEIVTSLAQIASRWGG